MREDAACGITRHSVLQHFLKYINSSIATHMQTMSCVIVTMKSTMATMSLNDRHFQLYYNLMGPASYMWSVIDLNVVMRLLSPLG